MLEGNRAIQCWKCSLPGRIVYIIIYNVVFLNRKLIKNFTLIDSFYLENY